MTIDEGLPHQVQTGVGGDHDMVSGLQSAIKTLVVNKDTKACTKEEILVYPLGTTLLNYEQTTPLNPDDKLPKGSTSHNSIFVHVPREKQDLSGLARRLHSAPADKPKTPNEIWVVTIRCPDDREFKAVINPKHRIKNIKIQIESEAGIEAPVQRLFLDGTELIDSKTAEANGIQNGDVLDLEAFTMFVTVRTPQGAMIPLQIMPTNTIGYIKEKVAPETGIPLVDQVLKYYGRELPTNKTADEVGLKDGSIIDLERAPFQIYVRTPQGTKIPIPFVPTDTIEAIKEKVEPLTNIKVAEQTLSLDGEELLNDQVAQDVGMEHGSVLDLERRIIKIHVRTPDGPTVTLRIKPTDTIETIKEKVAAATGIEVPNQILLYDGQVLPNGKTADEMGIKDESILDLVQTPITVHVRTPDGTTFPVTIDPFDTIQSIKQRVAEDVGIEPAHQILEYNGAELPDEQTADELELRNGSILDLVPTTMEVQVRLPDGYQVPVKVRPWDNIQFIKDSVAPQIGIEPAQQILSYNGEEAPDDKTAEELGLQDGSILDLEERPIEVFVRTPSGTTLPVTIQPMDTILSIKENVADKVGIEAPQQNLKFNGEELQDGQTADEAGLKDGSILDLAGKPIEVLVRMPNGHSVPVTMDPKDTIQFVKETVAPLIDIEPAYQILKYNNSEPQNYQTAEELGLKDGSVLDLEPKTVRINVITPDGETIPATIWPLDTIKDIKELLAPAVGMDASEQILTHKNKPLVNEHSAEEAGLQDGDTIYLQPKTMQVNVRTPFEQIIPVVIKPSDLIEVIKEAVAEPSGIEVPYQIMKFMGEELPNDMSAEHLGLEDGCMVDLFPVENYTPKPHNMSLLQCYYQLGDTVPYYIRIHTWEKIGVLKEKILETRQGRHCSYLDGIKDASELQVYLPGETAETGVSLDEDDTIPEHTSFEEPLIVVRP